MSKPEEVIAEEVNEVIALETSLAELEQELAQNAEFQAFLVKQKETTKQIAEFWKTIEKKMIDNNVKSIKGDWGSITIAERLGWDYLDTLLPNKFFKRVVDTKKMSDYYKLEGKAPKGATPKYTKYLTKRIKGKDNE